MVGKQTRNVAEINNLEVRFVAYKQNYTSNWRFTESLGSILPKNTHRRLMDSSRVKVTYPSIRNQSYKSACFNFYLYFY